MATTESRREAYRMYRSMGYTPAEARNMRNRSTPHLIADYREAMNVHNEERRKSYLKPFEAPYEPLTRPYRPEINATDKDIDHYKEVFTERNISDHFQEQIFDISTQFDLDIYERRFEGLEDFFESKDISWDELMDQLSEIEDLGDFLDILGELYDENNE